ncbi:hypothetical protein DFH09DRAFT_930715, partial [Mycena vulgaris]
MDSREGPDEALVSLYGPVLSETPPVQIYVEGAAPGGIRTKSAGAGIYFGLDSTLNRSLKVPGPGRPSSDRARVYAIYEALREVDPDRSILMYCTSKAVIRLLCYAAASKIALGWPGANGDLFKSTVSLLANRHAQTTFIHLDSKGKNEYKQQAYSLAK